MVGAMQADMGLEKKLRVIHLDSQVAGSELRHTSFNNASSVPTRSYLLIMSLCMNSWKPVAFRLPQKITATLHLNNYREIHDLERLLGMSPCKQEPCATAGEAHILN